MMWKKDWHRMNNNFNSSNCVNESFFYFKYIPTLDETNSFYRKHFAQLQKLY